MAREREALAHLRETIAAEVEATILGAGREWSTEPLHP